MFNMDRNSMRTNSKKTRKQSKPLQIDVNEVKASDRPFSQMTSYNNSNKTAVNASRNKLPEVRT